MKGMDTSANKIEAALSELARKSPLPTPVSSWQVETGLDSTEDPAVWVWAILQDDDVEFDKRYQLRSIIHDLVRSIIRDLVKEVDPSSFVYIRFRGASEEVEQEA